MFSGEMDKAFAAFTLATTGASMGMEVSMFFTFWGLNLLKKGGGPVPNEQLAQMMAAQKSPSINEFITMAHQLGVKLLPCSTTCSMMGISKEDLRPEASEMVGAAYFLNESREASITLFI